MTKNSQDAAAVQGSRVLADLQRNAADLDRVLAARYELIGAARAEGVAWWRIGEALGISTQGAHGWYNTRAGSRRPTGGRAKR